jgi:hypothetical protein
MTEKIKSEFGCCECTYFCNRVHIREKQRTKHWKLKFEADPILWILTSSFGHWSIIESTWAKEWYDGVVHYRYCSGIQVVGRSQEDLEQESGRREKVFVRLHEWRLPGLYEERERKWEVWEFLETRRRSWCFQDRVTNHPSLPSSEKIPRTEDLQRQRKFWDSPQISYLTQLTTTSTNEHATTFFTIFLSTVSLIPFKVWQFCVIAV